MASVTAGAAVRPRAFVRVAGAEAADYLQRMVSNDVAALEVGASCEALLLTPKARVIAPLRVLATRRGGLPAPDRARARRGVRAHLAAMRFAARCEIEPEEHASLLVLGARTAAIANGDYGVPAVELLDEEPPASRSEEELERLRIRARHPALGRELDDRVLPAEAGLEERAISFTKGCYPGQEPVARLHFRGHPNRTLRVLAIDATSRRPTTPRSSRRQGGRPRHERRPRREHGVSRSPTCGSRCPRTRSSGRDAAARPLH